MCVGSVVFWIAVGVCHAVEWSETYSVPFLVALYLCCDPVIAWCCLVFDCHERSGFPVPLPWFYIPRPFRASIAARLLWDCGLQWDWLDCDDCSLRVLVVLLCRCDFVIVLLCYGIGDS